MTEKNGIGLAFDDDVIVSDPDLWRSIGGRSMSLSDDEGEGLSHVGDEIGLDPITKMSAFADMDELISNNVRDNDQEEISLERMMSRDISMSFYDDEASDVDDRESEYNGESCNVDIRATQDSIVRSVSAPNVDADGSSKKCETSIIHSPALPPPPSSPSSSSPPSSSSSSQSNHLLKCCKDGFDINFTTKFFGCYWRNRNQNLLGFPFVKGMTCDYGEFFQSKDFVPDQASSNSHGDCVNISVRLPVGYERSRISLVARIIPVSEIHRDASLVGTTVNASEMQNMLGKAGSKDGDIIFHTNYDKVDRAPILNEAKREFPGELPESTRSSNTCAPANILSSEMHSHNPEYIAFLKPRWTWKYTGSGGRQRHKEMWTQAPVTDLEIAKTMDSMVTLQVLMLAIESSEESCTKATCISSICSPGFFVGSTRHLRRTVKRAKDKDDVTGKRRSCPTLTSGSSEVNPGNNKRKRVESAQLSSSLSSLRISREKCEKKEKICTVPTRSTLPNEKYVSPRDYMLAKESSSDPECKQCELHHTGASKLNKISSNLGDEMLGAPQASTIGITVENSLPSRSNEGPEERLESRLFRLDSDRAQGHIAHSIYLEKRNTILSDYLRDSKQNSSQVENTTEEKTEVSIGKKAGFSTRFPSIIKGLSCSCCLVCSHR